MPSTYSPALRLELIGNSEQAANWGNTTNTNLGTLLEQAITGVSTITMSDANYTLVSGNGVSDEARNAVLVMAGTLSATRDVIVPTSNKFYAVRNATTGGQSILVKTSGGTGVTLANGFTQLMYCDGTNVVLASIPINSSNGNVAVGGDLVVTGSITSGGTGLFPSGAIIEYGGISAPAGWLICDGSPVSRSTYAALFAVIGTAYGSGDGSTTFNLPDRRGRFGVGVDGTYTRGSTGGVASATTSSNGTHNHTGATGSTTLTTAQIPSHSHTGTTDVAGSHSHTGSTDTQGNHNHTIPYYNSGSTGGANLEPTGSAIGTLITTSTAGAHLHNLTTNTVSGHTHAFTSNATGGGTGHDHSIGSDGAHTHTVATIPPYLASNYIIKT